jgi:hypothetical protein
MELVNRSPCSRIFLPFTCLDMFNYEKNAFQVSVFRKIETTVNNNLTCKKIITAHRTLLLEVGLPNVTSTVAWSNETEAAATQSRTLVCKIIHLFFLKSTTISIRTMSRSAHGQYFHFVPLPWVPSVEGNPSASGFCTTCRDGTVVHRRNLTLTIFPSKLANVSAVEDYCFI